MYEAASEPALWETVVEDVRRLFRADGAILIGFGRPGCVFTPDIQDFTDAFFKDGWFHRNPYPAAMRRKGWAKKPFTGQMLYPDGQLERLEIQNDLTLKNGWQESIHLALTSEVAFTLGRRRGKPAFEASDVEKFDAAAGELQRAMRFATTVEHAHEAGMLTVLEHLDRGVIVLDWAGEIVNLNSAAERLLGDGLAVVGRRPVATWHTDAAPLEKYIAETLRPVAQAIALRQPPRGPVTLRRSVGRPLVVETFPLAGRGPFHLRRAAVVLLVTDPDAAGGTVQAIAQALFHLSPAEVRLGSALLNGESLEAFAEAQAISIETARKRLKSVFEKTDTHRQSELVALLGRLRPPLGRRKI
jgi:DNA-binding CsgD family transcriptional regulator